MARRFAFEQITVASGASARSALERRAWRCAARDPFDPAVIAIVGQTGPRPVLSTPQVCATLRGVRVVCSVVPSLAHAASSGSRNWWPGHLGPVEAGTLVVRRSATEERRRGVTPFECASA